MEMISTFKNLQNSNVKFVKKKLLKNKFLKCILKMSIKNLKNITVMSVHKFHSSWRKRFNCDQCGKNFARGCYLKVYIEIVHENLWIQLCSLWQKFHQSFHESDKTLDWNYKLQLFMKMKRFNFDQCGKNFAIGCNLNDHEIDSYNWIVNISFFWIWTYILFFLQ